MNSSNISSWMSGEGKWAGVPHGSAIVQETFVVIHPTELTLQLPGQLSPKFSAPTVVLNTRDPRYTPKVQQSNIPSHPSPQLQPQAGASFVPFTNPAHQTRSHRTSSSLDWGGHRAAGWVRNWLAGCSQRVVGSGPMSWGRLGTRGVPEGSAVALGL